MQNKKAYRRFLCSRPCPTTSIKTSSFFAGSIKKLVNAVNVKKDVATITLPTKADGVYVSIEANFSYLGNKFFSMLKLASKYQTLLQSNRLERLYKTQCFFMGPSMSVIHENLPFGEAIEAAKMGKCISRKGWNGKGMFVYLHKGSHDFGEKEWAELIDGVKSNLFDDGHTGTSTRLPCLNMLSATGSIVNGWLASQTDILAEDWCILEHDGEQ